MWKNWWWFLIYIYISIYIWCACELKVIQYVSYVLLSKTQTWNPWFSTDPIHHVKGMGFTKDACSAAISALSVSQAAACAASPKNPWQMSAKKTFRNGSVCKLIIQPSSHKLVQKENTSKVCSLSYILLHNLNALMWESVCYIMKSVAWCISPRTGLTGASLFRAWLLSLAASAWYSLPERLTLMVGRPAWGVGGSDNHHPSK